MSEEDSLADRDNTADRGNRGNTADRDGTADRGSTAERDGTFGQDPRSGSAEHGSGVDAPPPEDRPAASPPQRRRPIRDPFGDVLPDTTADERASDSVGHDDEAWYRENRPPHHDQY
jgi:hypothetical protein